LKSFGQLMVIVAKSDHKFKRCIGRKLLDKTKDYGLDPDLMILNWYLRVCSEPTNSCDTERRECWEEALSTLESLRSSKWGANSHSYNAMFFACDRLFVDPDQRFDMMSDVFEKCKDDGQVDRRIISSLLRLLPPCQFEKLTTLSSHDKRIQMSRLPKEWCRHKTSHQ